MKEKPLKDKLYKRRKSLGYSQEYMGQKLNITQSGYSLIEKGKTKFTTELLIQIKSIEGLEDFDESEEKELESPRIKKTIAEQWLWGKPLLYLTTIVLGTFLISTTFDIGQGIYRGFTGKVPDDPDIMVPVTLIYGLLGILFIRWLVFRKKW